jgi:hypothetical protein
MRDKASVIVVYLCRWSTEPAVHFPLVHNFMNKNTILRILAGIIGLVVIVAGVKQTMLGVKQMMGSGEDPQFSQLLTESDQAIDKANKGIAVNQEKFLELMNSVDTMGLASTRQQKALLASEVRESFISMEAEYRLAGKKLDLAAQHKPASKFIPYLEGKSQAYSLFADAFKLNGEIVGLVLDESVTEIDDFNQKLMMIVEQRDAAQQQAKEKEAAADALGKELQQPTNP